MVEKIFRISFDLYVNRYEITDGFDKKVNEYQLHAETIEDLRRQLVELEAVIKIQKNGEK